MGSTHPMWVDGYCRYVQDVMDMLRDVVGKWPDGAEKHDVSDKVKTVWRDCWSQAKVVLEIQEIPTEPENMLFMCMLLWKAIAKQVRQMSNVLLEVSDSCDRMGQY